MSEDTRTRTQRLLALVPWLAAREGVTIAEAAQAFGVSADVIFDDLRLLLVTGRPGQGLFSCVDIQFWMDDDELTEDGSDFRMNPDARITVVDPMTLNRPLRLDSDQVRRIAEQLELLEAVYSHVTPALATALEKFQVRCALDGATSGAQAPSGRNAQSSLLNAVNGAISTGRCLDITYVSDGSDEVSLRRIQPVRVVVQADLTYVQAWCHTRDAMRNFRCDRIVRHARSFAEPIDLSVRETQMTATAPVQGITLRVVIPPQSFWLLDEYRFTDIAPLQDGSVSASLIVGGFEWAVGWVLQHSAHTSVLEPADVVAASQERAQSALAAYSD